MAERNTVIIIDDIDLMIRGYKAIIDRHMPNWNAKYFNDSESACNYISNNRVSIIGYIQDNNRPRLRGEQVIMNEGCHFFENVICSLTPWARCLIASAYMPHRKLSDIFSIKGGASVNFIDKSDLFKNYDRITDKLTWVVGGHNDAQYLSSLIRQFDPAWTNLCRYISKNETYLHEMSSLDFELLTGEIFRSYGWDVEFTSRTRDGGHDVIAVREMPTSVRILVEAKRYSPERPVGVDIIRQLYGIKQAKAASQLVLVTSSFVTFDAKKEFDRVIPWELDFFERDKILEWCRSYSPLGWKKY